MAGLLNDAMPQQDQGGGDMQANPATFMTLQVLKTFFEPEMAEKWAAHAAQGNPAEVVASIATQAAMGSMEASQGTASEQDVRASLPDIIGSMVLFLVSAEVVPQEAAEQVAAEAMQMAGVGQQQQQGPQPGMPQQQGMPPQQGVMA